jgi:hypothetical protein
MNTQSYSSHRHFFPRKLSIVGILIATAVVVVSSGCGGGSGSPPPPKFSGNTNVTIALSGLSNDELVAFEVEIQNLTLTNQSGTVVSLVTSTQPAEFIHLNGQIEPLLTVSVPQGIYTSATATIGNATFTCLSLTPQGGVDTSTFAYGQTPMASVTVNLPAPITIQGDSMPLSLEMLASPQSAAFASCYFNGITPYAITPTFNLTPATFSSQPSSAANGKANGVDGEVASVNTAANSFVITYPETESPRTVAVSTGAATVYQGINNFAALTVGTFVDLDGAIQSDGSIMASRIAVEDPTATSVLTGPLVFVCESEACLTVYGREEQGFFYNDEFLGGGQYFNFINTAFQISGQLPNLNTLPFTPEFDASTMVAGQNVYLSTNATTASGGFPYVPISRLTLIPQTIDGTVSGTSTAGSFTVYTVTLASYDLFPTFAVQAGQNTLLTNPGQVEVYVDSSTQMLNTQTLAVNGLFRFYGMVFNDHGTLRMDCAQVNDGVSTTPAAVPPGSAQASGAVKVTRTSIGGPARANSVKLSAH